MLRDLVTGRLPDPALEGEFRASRFAEDRRFAATIAMAVLLLNLILVPVEWIRFPEDSGPGSARFGTRLVVLGLAAALAWAARRARSWRTIDRLLQLLIGAAVVITLGLRVIAERPAPAVLSIDFAIIGLAFLGMPNNRRAKLAWVGTLVAGNLALTWRQVPWFAGWGVSELAIYQLIACAAGLLAISRIDNGRRQHFLLVRAETQARTTLQATLDELRVLKGLVSSCPTCGRIKEEDGTWRPLQQVLTERAGAQLSHGLCGECEATLYPGL